MQICVVDVLTGWRKKLDDLGCLSWRENLDQGIDFTLILLINSEGLLIPLYWKLPSLSGHERLPTQKDLQLIQPLRLIFWKNALMPSHECYEQDSGTMTYRYATFKHIYLECSFGESIRSAKRHLHQQVRAGSLKQRYRPRVISNLGFSLTNS